MKVIIIGAGIVGTQLATRLIDQNHDVTIIESDATVVYRLKGRLDCLIVHDEGNNIDTLHNVEAHKADFFISVTDSDELNLLMCSMVRNSEGKPIKIARVRNIRYSSPQTYYRSFNIDYLINPETEAAAAMIRSLDAGAISNVLQFEHSAVQLRNMAVEAGSPLCNRELRDIGLEYTNKFIVALIIRGNQHIIPTGNTRLLVHDIIYIAAEEHEYEAIYRLVGSERKKIKDIVLVGGNRICSMLAKHILTTYSALQKRSGALFPFQKVNLKIIEEDRAVAERLALEYPQALIINGDISDNHLFEEEDLNSADLIIAATENDERNLLSATYSKILGIKRAIALVSQTGYPVLAHKLGIDATISLKHTVVNAILRLLYRKQLSSLHTIQDGEIEVIEFVISARSKADGQQIMNIPFPEDTLILSITRNKQTYIPRGEFVIRAEDRVAFIVQQKNHEKLTSILTNE